ncbi:hypothetical protein OIDMADRAFT_61546 [Oidiodendron maius Zn]|uniref:Uncharacterized protein n=1 Tax=Oidiodendron maius (strain Zn) TaxID=913774 RepID=A0A0C3GQI9_OIDMZ|nr:hypothetical protein OIDMADRAFT_61546 [Oidiodendron maius Zn]
MPKTKSNTGKSSQQKKLEKTYWGKNKNVPIAAKEVTKDSLECKVDQLWICIFAKFFPDSEGFIIVPKDGIENSQKAPDITIKYLHNEKKFLTVLTMENKRAKFDGQPAVWQQAVGELDEYLDLIPDRAKLKPKLEIGLVGIGKRVRFYCRRNGGDIMDYPGSKGRHLHVKKDAKQIEGLLNKIKKAMMRL